jgi:hypothetical protein
MPRAFTYCLDTSPGGVENRASADATDTKTQQKKDREDYSATIPLHSSPPDKVIAFFLRE